MYYGRKDSLEWLKGIYLFECSSCPKVWGIWNMACFLRSSSWQSLRAYACRFPFEEKDDNMCYVLLG